MEPGKKIGVIQHFQNVEKRKKETLAAPSMGEHCVLCKSEGWEHKKLSVAIGD